MRLLIKNGVRGRSPWNFTINISKFIWVSTDHHNHCILFQMFGGKFSPGPMVATTLFPSVIECTLYECVPSEGALSLVSPHGTSTSFPLVLRPSESWSSVFLNAELKWRSARTDRHVFTLPPPTPALHFHVYKEGHPSPHSSSLSPDIKETILLHQEGHSVQGGILPFVPQACTEYPFAYVVSSL